MGETRESTYLGEEKISKLLLKYSIPCILSLLIGSLYNIVDQIFIGNSEMGYLGNAATTVVFPLTVMAMAFAWCFGDGAAAYVSIAQGKKDTKDLHRCVANTFAAIVICSLLFCGVCALFMDPILFAFGASEASIGMARIYFVIIMAAMPFNMLMNTMNGVIRADGSPAYSMASLLVGAILNIILDPIFIFVFKWGIEGAAYATILGQIVSFLISTAYFFRSKSFRLKLESFRPDFKVLIEVIKLGFSTFITQLSIVIVTLVCNIMLVKYGVASEYGQDIPIAVVGIAMKVFTIVINIIVGIILGGQPILGYNYGAKNYKRVKETFLMILIPSVIVGIIATLIFELCPEVVINLFGSESELYTEFAVMTFRIYLALVACTCFIKLTSIFFQALGEPSKAAIISLVRDIICFVPLVMFLPKSMGITGVLWAAPVADIIGFSIAVTFVIRFFKGLEKEESNI